MKEISSKHVINKKSALSTNTKINILVTDLLRIMRNISPDCQKSERTKHIQLFLNRMQFSGYNMQERVKVYQRACSKYNKILENAKIGTCPLYRSKFWNKEQRDLNKKIKKTSSFKAGKYESVMFVDATPNSTLAKCCQTILDEAEIKIKVQERAGISLKRLLSRSNPFRSAHCENLNCNICTRTDRINCKQRDSVYEIKCSCGDSYIGETSRSISERFNEHITKKNSVLQRHANEKHHDTHQQYELQLITTCQQDAMLRQVSEAVYIREFDPSINAKEEWGNTNVPKDRRRNQSNVIKSNATYSNIKHGINNFNSLPTVI